MLRLLFSILALSSFVFALGGINPKNPNLKKATARGLYVQCEDNSKDSIDVCQKAILYEMHVHRKMHKGVSFKIFSPKSKDWVEALDTAEKETDTYSILDFNIDTALLNAMQGNTNSLSMGYEMTSKLSKLNNSIQSYTSLMKIVTKQSLIDFKIESAINELLYSEKMAKEIKNFDKQGK